MKRELHEFMKRFLSDSRLYERFVEQHIGDDEVKAILLPDYNSDDFFGETQRLIDVFDKYSVLDNDALNDFGKIRECCERYGVNVADAMQRTAELCYSGKLCNVCGDELIDKLAMYMEKALCDGGMQAFEKRIAGYAAAALKTENNCSIDIMLDGEYFDAVRCAGVIILPEDDDAALVGDRMIVGDREDEQNRYMICRILWSESYSGFGEAYDKYSSKLAVTDFSKEALLSRADTLYDEFGCEQNGSVTAFEVHLI